LYGLIVSVNYALPGEDLCEKDNMFSRAPGHENIGSTYGRGCRIEPPDRGEAQPKNRSVTMLTTHCWVIESSGHALVVCVVTDDAKFNEQLDTLGQLR
jgi:hypothetical protein